MLEKLFTLYPAFKSSINEKVLRKCSELGCCARCKLRYIGCRDADIHRQFAPNKFPISYISNPQVSHEFRPTKRVKTAENEVAVSPEVCPSCLGILQLDFESIAKTGHELFQKENYHLKEDKFAMSVQIPPQIIIRHHSTNQFIFNGIESIEESETLPQAIEVKEIVKYLCRDAFQSRSGLSNEKDVTH